MRREFVLGLVLVCGCTSGVFACEDDSVCGQGGTCQAEGWCSFPDAGCESGQRFGEHSGNGLAGTCVDPFGTTSGTPTEGSSTTPPDPTSADSDPSLDGPFDDSSDDSLDDDVVTGVDDDGSEGSSADDESTGAEVVLPAPLVWFSFDDLTDPYKDDSGNGHTTWCTEAFMECPIPVASAVGLGVEFDGLVQHLHIDHGTWAETTTGLTFASWVWLDPNDDGEIVQSMGIAMKPYGPMVESNSWVLGLDPMTGAIGAIVGENPLAVASGPYPFDTDWHHAAFAWDGETVRVYVDAVEVGSVATSEIVFDAATINLGAGVASGVDAAFLRGALDEIRIYDVALDAEQIAVLATPPRP